jgi:hypothetical protein
MYPERDAGSRRFVGLLLSKQGQRRAVAAGLSTVVVLGLAAGPADAAKKSKRKLADDASTVTIFGSKSPADADVRDTSSAELGVKFRSSKAGYILGVRFYKGATNTGTHVGALWSATGKKLASVTFSGESASGWQRANFAQPVKISADTTYIASYHASKGRYAGDTSYFDKAMTNAPLSATGSRYAYGSGSMFPTKTYKDTNYYVDVVYSATAPALPPLPPDEGSVADTPLGERGGRPSMMSLI